MTLSPLEGPEFALAEHRCARLEDVLPTWMQTPPLETDLQDVPMPAVDLPLESDLNDVGMQGSHQPPEASEFVFPRAVGLGGVLHALHNISRDMHIGCPGWQDLWILLKNVEAFVSKAYLVQRFISTCVPQHLGAVGEAGLTQLKMFSARLYEQRWGCVSEFVRSLQQVWHLLQDCWSEIRFGSGVDTRGPAHGFDPALLSSTVRSTLVPLQLALILEMQNVLDELGDWSEGCPCHEKWLAGLSRKRRENVMQSVLDNKFHHQCPFAGKRACEMAAGQLNTLLKEHLKSSFVKFMVGSTVLTSASQADVATCASMYVHCKSHIFLFLKARGCSKYPLTPNGPKETCHCSPITCDHPDNL